LDLEEYPTNSIQRRDERITKGKYELVKKYDPKYKYFHFQSWLAHEK
jgi:hypothetical protein